MSEKRNVLLFIADDLGKQLGCYGAKYIATPNIDRLSNEGTRFENAFASTASCSGSRSVIYTGLHTHQNGQYGLASHRHHFVTFDHVETMPHLLNQFGYQTGILGKIHVGPSNVYPWGEIQESNTRDVALVADQAREFFGNASKSPDPFCLTVGFIDPHRDSTRGGFGNDTLYDPRIIHADYSPDDVEVPPFISDTPGTRLELSQYYNSIHRLDQGVGMTLDALSDAGLTDSTLVIFISDNGPPFINSKTTLYDAGVRLPLIIKDPLKPPAVSPNLVSYVDILPTILDYLGHPGVEDKSGKRIGRSLISVLGNTSELPGFDHVFGSHTFHEVTNYWPTRFIRDRQFKYHRNLAWRLDFPFAADLYGSLSWEDVRNSTEKDIMIGDRKLKDFFFRPPEELYDLQNDPNEVNNLVDDPDYTSVLTTLRSKLETWQRRTEDPWLYRDGVSLWFIRHHLAAGLKVPDILDLDIDKPGNQEGKFVEQRQWG
ncbi:hypothetical protein N7478_012601 [Penicillium angulare]|uniref:uncharacterized protein n=1 Tax=Penicillium angulare TaxID=116970 RepID=UPI0025422251|nr:uncharacterized protein N7478_012601 [Penicillium angulare]KAJ5259620.1 hypothetical protein N7478_012601 [Penicillium angulare]